MAKINEKKLVALLKKRGTIEINNDLIKKVLGFDDMRDFTSELYHWGYNTDFTYNEAPTNGFQSYLRAFLKDYLN